MELSARDVLEQRSSTLTSLLETPGGPFGASSGALGQRLSERWRSELRLIARILDETPQGGSVIGTLDIWHARTEAFIANSDADEPAWTDRQGLGWRAAEVIEVLNDLRDRLASWRDREGEGAPGGPSAATATEATAQATGELPAPAPTEGNAAAGPQTPPAREIAP